MQNMPHINPLHVQFFSIKTFINVEQTCQYKQIDRRGNGVGDSNINELSVKHLNNKHCCWYHQEEEAETFASYENSLDHH